MVGSDEFATRAEAARRERFLKAVQGSEPLRELLLDALDR